MKHLTCILYILFLSTCLLFGQNKDVWHNKERELRYIPQGNDIVIVNGTQKFNRALYGTNTAFRIETSDVPEVGFFMPNMGGNLQLGIISNNNSLWLNNAKYTQAIYRAGARIYEIKDPLLGKGELEISVLAMANAEGMIMQIKGRDLPPDISLFCMYGGASNKRFSRNGDLGVDPPDCFTLQPEACVNNRYQITNSSFVLNYATESKTPRTITGIFPDNAVLKTGSPFSRSSPDEVWESESKDNKPVLLARIPIKNKESYYVSIKNNDGSTLTYSALNKSFQEAEFRRKKIAKTIKLETPDQYINPLGGVISIAADGIWDESWLHGAIGWRMPLNGWRAAYTGDVIGWHDRSRKHFDSYAASQIKHIEPVFPHPTQDSSQNHARSEKRWGTQMYSNGYICRNPNDTTKMHHYDMNLVYIDELLWHFNWTGDLEYVKKMWPVLERHLAWEKRNFDPDDDGLYDAYACIWASDALYYNSGGVTHSSAYNYRANKMAGAIAAKIGKNPELYTKEAEKILNAINSQLWLPDRGWWAEYKDFMGNKTVHPNAAIWTVYHALDSKIHDPFQAYQATRYIDTQIPQIPLVAKGLKDEGYYTVSTSNWTPYSWSINNVAFAEVAHLCLAYWQAGRYDEAFKLFKSSILDGMYLGSSPGNIGQISFYDAARGECYRDFGDPVGMYSRVLIQGLFGIEPNLMNNCITIRPGFPKDWNNASVSTSDIEFSFKRENLTDQYSIKSHFNKPAEIELIIKAFKSKIRNVFVNGKVQSWKLDESTGFPAIRIHCTNTKDCNIRIEWDGTNLETASYPSEGVSGDSWKLASHNKILKIYDPQEILKNSEIKTDILQGNLSGEPGFHTLFIQMQKDQMIWWQPVNIELKETFGITCDFEKHDLQFSIKNNTNSKHDFELTVNPNIGSFSKQIMLKPGETSELILIPDGISVFGTNKLVITEKGKTIYKTELVNWNIPSAKNYETINIDNQFNSSVSNIFKQQYLSPRSPYTTLQIPKQGIGEWCHPLQTAAVNDSGFRKKTIGNIFNTPFGIPFRTNEDTGKNIAFTSLWNNYPQKVNVPLSGKASHAYLLMAGTTNHMQCHITNGIVTVGYTDGSEDSLQLINPETWLPIEQDLYTDGYAFRSKFPRPYRVAFKTGIVSRNLGKELNISPDEIYGRNIEGGAGIIVDLPLDLTKELKSISVQTIANDVIIGLMGITLLH